MPVITSSKTKPAYDVIVVGSGAGGGMSAYALAMAGLKVLMLEAGRNYDPLAETPMFNTPQSAPLRGEKTPAKPFGYYDATVDGGWQVPGEPYTQKKGTQVDWMWWRARMLGGRTNHWGRISLRMGEYDFKPRQRDGLGLDWPLDYKDLSPYYDMAESLIGVYGGQDGLENTPDSPPGVLLPPPKPRGYEQLTKKHCDKLGIPVVPCHRAILTKPLDFVNVPKRLHPNNLTAQRILSEDMSRRAACFWATGCGRGCNIRANFQSTTVLIPPALATGNLDVLPHAMVREVTLDNKGRASGVHYIDKVTREDRHATARVIIVAASGCESARILLNSKSANHPNGLANSSGKVGKYLMDTVGASVNGQIPALENVPPHNEDGDSGLHVYMPWWGYQAQKAGKMDFARGYHVEFGGGRQMPGVGTFGSLGAISGGAYGKKLKEEARRYYGSFMGFAGRGEMIPNEDSYCEIDPTVVDQWGIPVLKFNWKWSDHETKQAAHMHKTFAEIIEAMGGKVLSKLETNGLAAMKAPGEIIHEVGTTCMGADSRTSVLNQWCQSWEIPNLLVTDAGPFVSNADKNPTLSILALAWRSCDHLMEEMKKGNV